MDYLLRGCAFGLCSGIIRNVFINDVPKGIVPWIACAVASGFASHGFALSKIAFSPSPSPFWDIVIWYLGHYLGCSATTFYATKQAEKADKSAYFAIAGAFILFPYALMDLVQTFPFLLGVLLSDLYKHY